MKKYLIMLFVVLNVIVPAKSWGGFPEFGFCPLGGPPGWFNRLTGQHQNRYYYPPPPMYPPLAPNTWQAPAGAYPYPENPVRATNQ